MNDANNQTSRQSLPPLTEGVEPFGDEDSSLIYEAFQRQELIKDLDRLIITDVRRRARRAWLQRWARTVAFSFGLPLLLLLWFSFAYLYIKEYGTTSFTLSLMLWPTLAVAASAIYALKTFSPDEL